MDVTMNCPVCGQICESACRENSTNSIVTLCALCGAVAISDEVVTRLNNNAKEKLQLQHLLQEKLIKDKLKLGIEENLCTVTKITEMLLKNPIYLIAHKDDTYFANSRKKAFILDQILKNYPLTITEKLNRIISNLARMQSNSSKQDLSPSDACMFARTTEEAKYFCGLLEEAGWCSAAASQFISQARPQHISLSITIEGWKHFETLERNWQNSTTAFIAMWFSDTTVKYREAVKEAIRQAGYEPKVIDDHEHNNFIMDEVINQINEAKFVIADFTCIPEQPEKSSKIPGGVRGGVYFEAGYAKGLGKEVIVTCKNDDDSKKRRHFDIDQLNTLFWDEKDDGKLYDTDGRDFVYRLAERIKATVGKGPFFVEET